MPKEWNSDIPIPRGHFMVAEDFPPDFAERAEARLKEKPLDKDVAVSIRYELGRFKMLVENNPVEAIFHFRRVRDDVGPDSTRGADARRWVSRCIEKIGDVSISVHGRTLAGLLNSHDAPNIEDVYETQGDTVGIGFAVLDRMDREMRLQFLNHYGCASAPKKLEEDLRYLERSIAIAESFLAEVDGKVMISDELRTVSEEVRRQKVRMRLLVDFTERLAKS